MKLALSVLGASAIGALALVSVAIAQPPGQKPGGFSLLQHDANGDGRLIRAEFDAAQKARFDSIDANKDGSATPEEFRNRREAQMNDHRAAEMAERFDALDTDKNGQLTRAEFSTRPSADDEDKRGGGRHGGRDKGRDGDDRRARADANADGTLMLTEFTARGAEAFTRADANKDGVVTVAELQSLRPSRR